MTADELQQLATRLSGYGWCRHWLQWAYPSRATMAVQVYQFRHDPSSDITRLVPIRVEELESLGFKRADGFDFVYTIERTHADGSPYGTRQLTPEQSAPDEPESPLVEMTVAVRSPHVLILAHNPDFLCEARQPCDVFPGLPAEDGVYNLLVQPAAHSLRVLQYNPCNVVRTSEYVDVPEPGEPRKKKIADHADAGSRSGE